MRNSWVYGCVVWLTGMPSLALADLTHPQRGRIAAIKQSIVQRLTTELTCVKAATSLQDLHKCCPRPPAEVGGRPDGLPPGPYPVQ